MPIFEFLCPACNRIYSFLALAPAPSREPTCPRCGGGGLARVPSSFAVVRAAAKAAPNAASAAPDDAAMGRMEREIMQMADGLDDEDAENPRVMARMMRRMAEASGEPMTPTMQEMFRRLESGEDPEALEEELGPQLEAESGGSDEDRGPAAPTRDEGLYNL